MPLVEACSLTSYEQNIRAEIRAGKPPEQAAAIARDVLERACKRIGKPVPQRTAKEDKKPSRKKTREYLEAALEHARKMLPGWMYSVIHQAALPSSGGRALANRRMTPMEKAWVTKQSCGSMTNGELRDALYKLNVALASAKRQGKDTAFIVGRGATVVAEMRKRGLDTPGALAKAVKGRTKKGFVYGGSEGGAHAHALNRQDAQTGVDGAHGHAFVLPGEDMVVFTLEDGVHEHALAPDGTTTQRDGKHSHRVCLPSGREADTSIDGAHVHTLMLETTTLAAQHTHELKLRDGTVVQSMDMAALAKRFASFEGPVPLLPPASEIVGALSRARYLADELESLRTAPVLVPEAVEMVAKGEPLPPLPAEAWEVVGARGAMVTCQLQDGVIEDFTPAAAMQVEPGDIVSVSQGIIESFSAAAAPDDSGDVALKRLYVDEVTKATRAVPFDGPSRPRLVFVSSSPAPIEQARGAPLVGPDGDTFQGLYLSPLGLTRKDVAVGFARPIAGRQEPVWGAWLDRALAAYPDTVVVALGKVAKDALGDRAKFALPHPAAVRRFGDSGEVTRKVRAMAKALDIPCATRKDMGATRPTDQPNQGGLGTTPAETTSGKRQGASIRCKVVKAAPEKRIVYGVVLDPYAVDLQNEWVPPATIEDSAHEFVEKSRVIGLKHVGKADASLVESWVELYPSPLDREAALENRPHRVFRRPFGSDTIHSGSWVAGVRLGEDLWDLHQRGELNAFSVGGFSFKTKVSTDAMPDVEFIDVAPTA